MNWPSSKEKKHRVRGYDDELYSSTTIIRVDLHYRIEAQARLRVESVFDDLDRLIAKHRRNPLFDHLIGYIYSVE